MAVSSNHNGFHWDRTNSRLDLYYRGTKLGYFDGSLLTVAGATGLTVTNAITATSGAITATAGNVVITAGDLRVTAGNSRLGAVSAFATTEPTSALVMKQGTAPVGAVTTSGGIFTDGTVVKKIIAAGTASNVET